MRDHELFDEAEIWEPKRWQRPDQLFFHRLAIAVLLMVVMSLFFQRITVLHPEPGGLHEISHPSGPHQPASYYCICPQNFGLLKVRIGAGRKQTFVFGLRNPKEAPYTFSMLATELFGQGGQGILHSNGPFINDWPKFIQYVKAAGFKAVQEEARREERHENGWAETQQFILGTTMFEHETRADRRFDRSSS